MYNVKIEKGIPLPKPTRRGRSRVDRGVVKVLREMRTGDSVLFTDPVITSRYCTAVWGRIVRERDGRACFTARRQPDGSLRVWCIDDGLTDPFS